ncbi:DUF2567 domain-containing protein [Gordonia sp. zg691]|uniref:DUF2567 domain-containing protein n=2 Tax=Gordonia jinghuaiqii TaxID=2758710 RepID=A0A7D7RE63_9ACTN|nr:DUF2567 domain-containing protein [Gordonia jinghuaiqii]MCR5977302.1 DUF2567 domain-containing protein [Gordonia jinghuaiqii]QMT03930.1 DUF2567 domain-containing protein [Gordonia jinghuaiqii]
MIWASLTPPSTGVVIEGARGDIPVDFDGIGAFALVMFGYGGVAALVVWLAAKPWRGVVGFVWPALGTVAGAALAATAGMRIAGLRFHDDPADLPVGTMYRVVPELWLEGATRAGQSASWTLLICAPFAFALVYLVCVLSSRTADLGVGDLDLHDPSAEELTSAGVASRTHR